MSMPTPATALYTAAQARTLDRVAAERYGLDGLTLMRRAGESAFALLKRRWPDARRLLVLCGPGSNGGDGFWLAKCAHADGLQVEVGTLAGCDVGAAAYRALVETGVVAQLLEGADLPDADVIVDALYGIGLSRPLDGVSAAVVAEINRRQTPILALDVPSGLDADTGTVLGSAVRATATVSFIGWKRGLFTAAGPDHAGALELATLDVPAASFDGIAPDTVLLAWPDVTASLPQRLYDVHKGLFGHVLAIGGDHGMGGAIRLAAEAALRVGAGLVSVATRADNIAAIQAARPELMPHSVDGMQDLNGLLGHATVLALGPGLGMHAWGHAHWHAALARGLPVVVDADALNLLAASPRRFSTPAVLTPHPGEAARLLGSDIAAVQRDRFAAARELARRFNAVVVLKGVGSLIAAPSGALALCPWGNPGMASGGLGDVLTGVIAGLLAQRLDPWHAACLGVALHARAGDVAANEGGLRGLVASDLFTSLRRLANPEMGHG